MKNRMYGFILFSVLLLMGCNSLNLPFKPSPSINKQLLTEQQVKNEAAWKAAFKFLNDNDLSTLAVGRYELTDGVYATVSDYQTKEPEMAKYEAHRKYIDIQYVVEGCEYIELMSLKDIKEPADYKEESDIAFFKGKKGNRLYVDKEHYFVFFPEDAHKPCLKVDTSSKVRKIVVKVPWMP